MGSSSSLLCSFVFICALSAALCSSTKNMYGSQSSAPKTRVKRAWSTPVRDSVSSARSAVQKLTLKLRSGSEAMLAPIREAVNPPPESPRDVEKGNAPKIVFAVSVQPEPRRPGCAWCCVALIFMTAGAGLGLHAYERYREVISPTINLNPGPVKPVEKFNAPQEGPIAAKA